MKEESYAGQLFFYYEIGILLGIVVLLKMYLYSCIALISFLIVFQNSRPSSVLEEIISQKQLWRINVMEGAALAYA